MSERDQFFLRQNMNLLCRDDTCSVYRMKNETGDGTATVYEVFPGIIVMYNDFHMEISPSRNLDDNRIFSIHHCQEGRIEWEVRNGGYLYLSAGDMMVDTFSVNNFPSSLPASSVTRIRGCLTSRCNPEITFSTLPVERSM